MAHSCPDCDEACYCGGDIDDIFFDDIDAELNCTHCSGKVADEESYNDFDDDFGLAGPEGKER